jgi:hypothetical protein
LTLLAIVLEVVGARFSDLIVVALGIFNRISDGFGIGHGDYKANKSEKDFMQSEQKG